MVHRDRNEFDPTDGGPESEDAFARGAGDEGDDAELFDAVDADDPGVSDRLADLERRLTEAQDKYLRQAAEYDNFRKRTARERAEMAPRAQADLVKQLLDPLDD